ncbi:MAG: YbaK/EbsC family protein [Anaerolineae bacterium]|nr:YbaK/EbsC family protein [Anaerolineae bacterium]MDW8070105.1 YbaK/EbsC family protein [Anaerolineae bacterium]
MHPSAQKVAQAAQELGLAIEVVEFAETTRTAPDAANAIGCHVAQIVKSLLFLVDGRPMLVLVSGANRLDEAKLAALCGTAPQNVKRADAETAKTVTGFAVGGIPPFGHTSPLPTYIDADLIGFPVVWAAAGTPHSVFAITPHDLIRATKGIIADLKTE